MTMSNSKKRKLDSNAPEEPGKRMKMTVLAEATVPQPQAKSLPEKSGPGPSATKAGSSKDAEDEATDTKKRQRIKKLKPKRPFPTVPASVSATGPRSAHREGKNLICISRKTPLGAYMRRCKDIIIKDGYVSILILIFLN